MSTIAIVTGASSGLGAAFTHQLDKGAFGRLDEIWIIARHADKLEALARSLSTPARPFALDLADETSYEHIAQALAQEKNLTVALLINNAGFGAFGSFSSVPAEQNAAMVRLLALAPVELSYQVLPYMLPGSRILNVSSAAAFMPQPRLSVYSAAKRFVLDFSRALDTELKSVGIHVTAVCPRFMRTAFLDHTLDSAEAMRMARLTGFEKPEHVAVKALRAARLGHALCIPSPYMRALYAATKVLPYPVALSLEQVLMGPASEPAVHRQARQ